MEDNREFVICFGCGEEILKDEAIEKGKEFVCEVCDFEYYECRICGNVHKIEDLHYDSYNEDCVCDDCYCNYGFITCEDCGEIIDEYASIGECNKFVCLDCAKKNYYQCDDCGHFFEDDEVYRDNFNNCICHACFDDYTICDDCGEIIYCDNANYTNDSAYCDDCYRDHEEDDMEIHSYSYKPSPNFYYINREGNNDYSYNELKDTLYLGVELEVDKGENKDEAVRNIHEYMDWTYCKEDSSLDDGIELVSHPMTLDFAMKNKEVYSGIFVDLLSEGWRGHDATTCGLHCHVNRKFFGGSEDTQDLNIAKVILLVNNLWEDMKRFSRRTESQLDRWAKRYGLIDGVTEENEIVQACKRQFDRYFAVNVKNTNTIEFRLFRSTLKINTFFATLQFVSNICHLVKEVNLKDINKITMQDILEYKEYEELKQYYIQRKLLKEEK